VTWLARQARTRPDAVAVRVPGGSGRDGAGRVEAGRDGNEHWQEVTYRELARRAGVASARLAGRPDAGPDGRGGLGVGPGDRVAVALPATLDHLVVIHAIAWCGAVLVPLDPRLGHEERNRRLAAVGASLLVCPEGAPVDRAGGAGTAQRPDGTGEAHPPEMADGVGPAERTDGIGLVAAPACRMVPAGVLTADRADPPGASPRREPPEPVRRAGDDLHSIVFTSGSTGRPEPVELTWGNHLASATASAFNLGVDRRDDWLCCLPLVHVGGLAIVLRSVLYGTALTLLDGFDAARVAGLLRGGRITLASLVPTMLRRILALPDGGSDDGRGAPDPIDRPGDHREEVAAPGLRAILLGGGPAEPALVEAAWRAGLPVLPTYGMTETASQVATLPPDRLDRPARGGRTDRQGTLRAGSAGSPLFGAEIAIRGGDGRPLEAPADQADPASAPIGEIWVRGPMVARSAPADGDGWLRTGDLGRIDAAGDLWVTGRRDRMIVTGGENVSPERVEAVLATHPEVAEAAVTGVDDPEWGQAVAAVLVPRNPERPPRPAALVTWCRERLAPYEVPKRWLVVPDLPRTAAGKARRDEVTALLADAAPPPPNPVKG